MPLEKLININIKTILYLKSQKACARHFDSLIASVSTCLIISMYNKSESF